MAFDGTLATLLRVAARRTKIMATIGPASDDPAILRGLIDAGMDAARVGLAHGDISDSIARIRRIRVAAAAANRHIAVLVDLPGPKVRTSSFPEAGSFIESGSLVELAPIDEGGSDKSDDHHIGVEHPT